MSKDKAENKGGETPANAVHEARTVEVSSASLAAVGEATASIGKAVTGVSRFASFVHTTKFLMVLYLVFLAIYMGASGVRLRRHSAYNHFVYLADAWLHGSLAITRPLPNENDWALVENLTLKDGRHLSGVFSKRGPTDRFRTLAGQAVTVGPEDIQSRDVTRYVSFPPLPALLMVPLVAVSGLAANDVLFTVLWAAANPVLLFLLLGALRKRGYSRRSPIDDLWLVAMFGIGTVYFYVSVVGQVWYTAHVVATTMAIGYAWASLDARRPMMAGLFLGLGFATRTPMGFIFPFFVWEVVRSAGGPKMLWRTPGALPAALLKFVRFGIPAAMVLGVLLWHNHLRFEQWSEFGHRYLNIVWAERIQKWGLFNYHFLSRNLAVALILLPRILARAPYVQISMHGVSAFVTSPTLAYLFPSRSSRPNPLTGALWITVLAAAIPSLLYQNSGFVQFGYRFSLDYMIFLIMILALNGRPLTRLFKALLVVSVVINLFGAITFDRYPELIYSGSIFPHGND